MCLLSPVTCSVQSVEIYVWIITELAPDLGGVSPWEGAEEGVDQEATDLVLGHCDTS